MEFSLIRGILSKFHIYGGLHRQYPSIYLAIIDAMSSWFELFPDKYFMINIDKSSVGAC